MLTSFARSPFRAFLSRSYSRSLPVLSSTQLSISTTYPYAVPRNTRGSLPVYTDIRNSNRHLTLIRNVEGDVDALVTDIARSLFPPSSPQADRLRVHAVRSRHLVLSGGKWKNEVIDWLRARGF